MKLSKIMVLFGLAVVLLGCSSPAATPSSSNSAITASAGGADCSYQAAGTASKPVKLPATSGVIKTGSVEYVLELDGQAVGLTLDRAAAPCAVNSFASLAAQGFYDATSCHRLGTTIGFQMLQCGDPTGTGTGGPGYTFAEELTGSETYPAGTLAMARTSQPSSQGSQFFLVFGDTQLSPDYTVFGKIDSAGLAVLRKLAAQGTDESEGTGVGKPVAAAAITSVKPR